MRYHRLVMPRYRKPKIDWRYALLGIAVWAALTLLTPLARVLASYGW